jgi:tetratricopeptide (TPR) repeat protein
MGRRRKSAGKNKAGRKKAAHSRESAPAVPRKKTPLAAQPWFPWLLLALVTVLAYANAWPNILVFDDKEFLGGDRFSGLELADFAGFFSQALWEASGNTGNLYRPALMVSFGIQNMLFEDWPAGFHLVNIFLHVLATLLVFGFLREVMRAIGGERPRPDWPVLLAAMVFGVHPVLTDAVNSVFNGSEIYVAIGTCGGLWYLLSNYRQRPVRAWLVLALLYFWALLNRESAVALPALAAATVWLTSREAWPARIRQCLPVLVLLVPLACYFAMRSYAFEAPDRLPGATQKVAAVEQVSAGPKPAAIELPIRYLAAQDESPRRAAPDDELESIGVTFRMKRAAEVIPMWFDALKLMVWPHPLLLIREVSDTPWLLALVSQLLLLGLAVFAWIRKQPVYMLGLALFYLAILPASRVVSEGFLPPLLMDRMLYLPSVGLMLCLAAGLQWLGGRTSARTAIIAAALLVSLLVPVTWARNHTWSDEIRLLETDFAVTEKNPQLLFSVVASHWKADNPERAMELCESYPELVRRAALVSRECAKASLSGDKLTEAEEYLKISLEKAPRDAWTHFEYARLLVRMERRDEARAHFDKALVNEDLPYLREIMSAFMLLDLYPYDRTRLLKASEHVDNALELQPRSREAKQLRDLLDKRL